MVSSSLVVQMLMQLFQQEVHYEEDLRMVASPALPINKLTQQVTMHPDPCTYSGRSRQIK